MHLLTQAHQNAKTAKNSKHDKYLSAILHLAPHTLSGYNVCPAASKGCAMACLNTAGRGRFNNVQEARIRKTKLLFQDTYWFYANLIKDINSLVTKAIKLNKIPVVRLNGTSDIDWENQPALNGMNLFDLFPMVQFYDYSKRVNRCIVSKLPTNYHLTFSLSESNLYIAQRLIATQNINVAVVFRKEIPDTWLGRDVINGDSHDLRFLEGFQGKWIGLKAKGKAKKDTSGFVRDI